MTASATIVTVKGSFIRVFFFLELRNFSLTLHCTPIEFKLETIFTLETSLKWLFLQNQTFFKRKTTEIEKHM